MKTLKATLREITKDLKLDIKAFDVPYERIEPNLRLDLNNCRSKSSILEHIAKLKNKKNKKNIEENFSTVELNEKLSIILPYLEKNSDSRLNLLLKFQGPFCKVEILKTHKHLLRKEKGIYLFYNKKTLEPLYVGLTTTLGYKRFMSYFSITTGNCMYNGQGTTVRVNHCINEFLNQGNSIGLAIIPMSNSSKEDIYKEERRLITKFIDNKSFWNINR
tara:strand:+ start:158 stop:811 length:654 start_codon:yes stop_codon:yes gene_type:complete